MNKIARCGMGMVAATALAATFAPSISTSAFAAPNPNDATAPLTAYTSGGVAYGSKLVMPDDTVASRPSAKAVMCTQTSDGSPSNNVAGVDLTNGDLVGAVTSSLSSARVDGRRASTSTASVADATLLGGVVELGAITSTSRVYNAGDDELIGEASSTIGSLSIAGQAVPLDQLNEPQTIEIPGVVKIDLNKSKVVKEPAGKRAVNTAVRITAPDGTITVLGQTRARLTRDPVGLFGGGAWGSEIEALDVLSSGKTALQPLPCRGTGNQTLRNVTAGVNIPGAANIGATVSTAQTFREEGKRRVTTESRVARVSLGGGQLVLEGIVGKAQVVKEGDKVTPSTAGTTLGALIVNGERQTIPEDEQVIEIPGVGVITLNDSKLTRRGARVTAVKVELFQEAGAPPVVVKLGNAVAQLR